MNLASTRRPRGPIETALRWTSPGSRTTRPSTVTTRPAAVGSSVGGPRRGVRAGRAGGQVARRRLHGRGHRPARRHDRLRARPRARGHRGLRAAVAADRRGDRPTPCSSRATTTSAPRSTSPPACATPPDRARCSYRPSRRSTCPRASRRTPHGVIELRGSRSR